MPAKCHGCNDPLESGIFEVRIYHGQCDPQGRVESLERALKELVAAWDDYAHEERFGHGITAARAALAYKPVQLGGKVSRASKPAEPA